VEIKLSRSNKTYVAQLTGEIDLFHSNQVKELFNKLVAGDAQSICVDLDGVTYIDSSGVGAMLYMYSVSKNKAIPLCFCGVKGSVRRVIELTKLLAYLPIEETLKDALQRLSQ
jgi:anti-sigma B factor antagonist